MPIFSLLILWLLPKPKYFKLVSASKMAMGDSLASILKTESFLTREYRLAYCGCHEKVIGWHKAELEKLDYGFHLQQASLRLVSARQKAQDQGIGPLDPRYPDLYDFVPRIEIEVPK